MQADFLLPDVGEGLEEATIVEWSVQVGDHINLNERLCIIETAKAEVELPSPYSGTLLICNGSPGEELRVGELLARFEVDDVEGASPPPPAAAPAAAAPATNGTAERAGTTPTLVGYGVDESQPVSRGGRRWSRPAADPSGPAAAAPVAPAAPAAPPAAAPVALPERSAVQVRQLAAPPVRKFARDLGIDLTLVTPTGSRGQITRDDVRRAQGAAPAVPTAPAQAVAATTAPLLSRAPTAALESREIPVRGVRARIAQRMTLSRSTIPEATCGVWADFYELMQLRDRLRPEMPDGEGRPLTPFAIVAWLAVKALQAAPILNSTFHEDKSVIEVFGSVHLGIATSTEQGLIAPVVRNAESLTLTDLSLRLAELASGAREGSLPPNDLTGSTFTITNYGALGLDDGNPVINFPEAAILGVGSIRPRPAVVDGEIVPRPLGKLICAFDHRVCDGADAGNFLARLKKLVEHPELALLGA